MTCRTRSFAIPAILPIIFLATGLTNAEAATEPPKTIDPDAACATKTCHPDIKASKRLHGPVAGDACTECHVPKDNQHAFTYPAEGKKLCETCHEPFGKKVSLHEPATEDCATCHDPHGGPTRGFLVMPMLDICEACHDKEVGLARSKGSAHSAAIKGKACMTCHTPHVSDAPKLLTAKPFDLCMTCHDKEVKKGDRIIPSTKKEIAGKKFVHGPVDDKECEACHDAHGSKYAALVKEPYPGTFYAPFTDKTYALCFSCHDEVMLANEKTDEDTEFRNGTRNLHYLHVHKKVKGRSCRACHAVHAGKQPALVRESVPFGRGGWSIRIRFTRTDDGGTCASACHVPRTYDREKPVEY